jgi:CBS domain-containing protein
MHDIAEFLGGRDPFSGLDPAALDRLAQGTEVEFFPAGEEIFPQGAPPQDWIRVVRKGSVELLDHGRPMDLLGEGEMFGHPSVLTGQPTRFEARAREDSLTYALVANEVVPLLGRPSSVRYLAQSLLARGKGDTGEIEAPSAEVARQSAGALVRRPPVVCEPDTSLRKAARIMDAEGVSSVLIGLGNGDFGIVTDSDLRSSVVAGRISPDDLVTAAMSAPVLGVGDDQTGADVMLTMIDHDIRHVPVFSSPSEVLGVIVAIDLIAAEASSPFVLRREISRARSKEELREVASQLRSTVVALHHAELTPFHISDVISAVTDALIRRMIELAIDAEGPPPAEFSWMALGSHGRREPVPSSDVDSGLAWRDVPENDPLPMARQALATSQTERYMGAIAANVADCIRVLGWKLDPHGVTAGGSFSASSIEDWRRSIQSWMQRPSDNRVLIAISILLDGRVVYGPERGLDVKPLLFETEDRSRLEAWMLRLALAAKPPTGFIRDIVVYASGKRQEALDIKHGGLLPVVDLARYAALRGGIQANHTLDRLRAAAERDILGREETRVLEEAFELFSALRLEHQVRQLEEEREPDDELDPQDLDPLTRRYLRDAFREVAAVQHDLVPELDRNRGSR